MSEGATGPKVFLSYAWTSSEHVDWVENLAKRLGDDNIHAVFDQWDLKEGQDKYAFMESMVVDPDVSRVIAVCDKKYAEKANKRTGGVGTESQIISAEVYEKVNQEKFIPIVVEKDDDGNPYLPVFFKGRIYIDFTEDADFEQSYERLVRNIYGKPERVRPAKGKTPSYVLEENAPAVTPVPKLNRLRSAVERGRPSTDAMLQEYLDAFSDGMQAFRIPVGLEKPEFNTALMKSLNDFLPWRDNFIELVAFVASYMDSDDSYERIMAFFEKIAEYQDRPASVMSYRDRDWDNYKIMVYELFLYALTVLIKTGRYDRVAAMIEHPYHVRRTDGERGFAQVGVGYMDLQPDNVDNFLDLMKRRSNHPKIRLPDIAQTDLLLFVRHYFPARNVKTNWGGRLVCLVADEGTPELFAKATSDKSFVALKTILGVSSRAELVRIIRTIPFARALDQHNFFNRRFAAGIESILNLQAIERAN